MIKQFQGEYRWLSNFTPVEIELRGIIYPSVEHAYMSAKCKKEFWKKFCSDEGNTPGLIKRRSRTVKLVRNWNKKKLKVMAKCLRQKFNQEPFRTKLLETGIQYIQEGNHWKDTFWGISLETGKGDNHLGRLIMEVRDSLK